MKYMLAVDYDNTLFQNGEIAKDTLDAIRQFREDGNLFGIVSGRDYVTGYKTFREENLFEFDFLLLKTGAMAVDANGNVLYEKTFNGSMPWGKSTLVSEVFKCAFEMGAKFGTTSVGKGRKYYYRIYPDGLKREYREAHPHSELTQIGDVGLVSVICENDNAATTITATLKEVFGSVLNPLQNTIAIDISAYGIDKASGTKKFAEHMQIPVENIWVAGDNYNDIAMLKAFHSCAMANGVPEAKAVAKYTCDTVGDVIKLIYEKGAV